MTRTPWRVGAKLSLLGLSLATALPASAQTPVGVNLLTNPGFENGSTGWTAVQSTVTTVLYGAPGYPTPAVSTVIGGGAAMLADLGGDAIVQQTVGLSGVPAGAHLVAGGFFGGGGVDRSRLEVRFLSAGGTVLPGTTQLDWVSAQQRNSEAVLKLRMDRIAIPAGSTQVQVRVEFDDVCCSGVLAAADGIFARLELGSLIPPAVPLDTQLLLNGSFEDLGWNSTSPLSLAQVGGWEGAGVSPAQVVPYSDIGGLEPAVSCVIGGGPGPSSCPPFGAGRYVNNLGETALVQRIDLRGNSAQFTPSGSLRLRTTSFLGGAANTPDVTALQITFRDSLLNVISATPLQGPITPALRNDETVLLANEGEHTVPPGTAFAEVLLLLDDVCCSGTTAYADRLDVRLVAAKLPTPLPLGINLVANGSFEMGSLPGSPLVLDDVQSWLGSFVAQSQVQQYGSSANLPNSSFGPMNGLGGNVLRDFEGDGGLHQRFDLAGNAIQVDLGQVQGHLSAWLGGHSTDQDSAQVSLTFLNTFGAPLGSLLSIGPVTAADRANQTTLLPRQTSFSVPPGTRSMLLSLSFNEVCCSGSNATADDIRLFLTSTNTGNPILLPGTGEDLRLFTGINGPPTSGPGQEVKLAKVGDVVEIEVLSPLGTYNGGPLMVGATGFATAAGPQYPLLLPDVWLDTNQVVLLLNGLFCSGFGCPVVVAPGTVLNAPLPVGLSGLTIRIQALAFAPPGSGVVPANGAYASTEAHDIRVQ
jgi:hypothetical protein